MGCQGSKQVRQQSEASDKTLLQNKAGEGTKKAEAEKHFVAGRCFSTADARGGCPIVPSKTACVFIEYQNEFTTVGGKLHEGVKAVMLENGMLDKSVEVARIARQVGAKVFHAPISFAQDASDNPNKNLGILAGCANDRLFTTGTWNAEFCDRMRPQENDVVISGKRGLDAFFGTDLECKLREHKIDTIALGGFLSNCCVESTMRTACELGFNVVTLTDCTATTSLDGQRGATEDTFGLFSTPMTSAAFCKHMAECAQKAQSAADTHKLGEVPRQAVEIHRAFPASQAKGGTTVNPTKTACLFIEYQNEFTMEGGKLHEKVKPGMEATRMIDKSVAIAQLAREVGAKVFHAPISFAADASDNPNKRIGILAGCANDKLFTAGTWNAEICDAMKPQENDITIVGKKGLDAFPGTDLENKLKEHGIEHIALAGFLSNCCVESTMRSACEKGFNVITLTDCTATTSKESQQAATEGTYGMFSKPMTAYEFSQILKPAAAPTPNVDHAVDVVATIEAAVVEDEKHAAQTVMPVEQSEKTDNFIVIETEAKTMVCC